MRSDHPIMRSRIKCSAAAFPHAADLMSEILGNSRGRLGADPGATYAETVAGVRLIAYRLNCGGVEVREIRQTKSANLTEGRT